MGATINQFGEARGQRQSRENQLKQSQSIPKQNQSLLQSVKSNIGVLKSNWYSNKTLITQSYGTAFVISPQKIITCTHNIYSQYKQRFASEIQFYSSINQGKVQKQKIIVERELEYNKNIFTLFQYTEGCSKSFDLKPHDDQICVIFLSTQLKMKRFIPIGQLDPQELRKGKPSIELQLLGYPSENYMFQSLINANIKRLHLKGHFYSIENKGVIHHDLQTSTGCSGSPILAKINQTYYAVGIHTHRGMGNSCYNSGVYFSQQNLRRIEGLEIRIEMKWGLKADIQYINYSKLQRLSPHSIEEPSQMFKNFTNQIFYKNNNQINEAEQQSQDDRGYQQYQKQFSINQQKQKYKSNLLSNRSSNSSPSSMIKNPFQSDQDSQSSSKSLSNHSIIDCTDIIDYFSILRPQFQENYEENAQTSIHCLSLRLTQRHILLITIILLKCLMLQYFRPVIIITFQLVSQVFLGNNFQFLIIFGHKNSKANLQQYCLLSIQ